METVTIKEVIEDDVLRTRVSNILVSAVCEREIDASSIDQVLALCDEYMPNVNKAIIAYYEQLGVEVDPQLTREDIKPLI